MYYRRSQYDSYLYPVVRVLSYAIRYAMCYLTIEQIPIFESDTAQWIWSAIFGGVIYSVFWFICYHLVRKITEKTDIVNSSTKSILYFLLYIPLIAITIVVLEILTAFGVLPISNEITFNLFEFLIECFANYMTFFINLVTEIALGVSKAHIL